MKFYEADLTWKENTYIDVFGSDWHLKVETSRENILVAGHREFGLWVKYQ